jgi:hypothetical protein
VLAAGRDGLNGRFGDLEVMVAWGELWTASRLQTAKQMAKQAAAPPWGVPGRAGARLLWSESQIFWS